MSHYSIKDLEQLSGIKAHTLRIWEQRYNLLNPKRTETNIRFYDDKDLKHILNVSLLNKKGFKISKIASMDEKAIQEKVLKLNELNSEYEDYLQALILSMIDFDELRFEKTVNLVILRVGFETAMFHIIYPFLKKVGILWQTGTVCPAHEHFITNLIRQKLIVAIDGQILKETSSNKKFMLFLPEGELHELGLLYASFLIKSRGFNVIYLGQSLPLDDLYEAYKAYRPDYLLTIITSFPDMENLEKYLSEISKRFPIPALISGFQIVETNYNPPPNFEILKTSEELVVFLQRLSI